MTIIDDEYFKTGFELCLQNSKSLFKIAEKSADENEFGIARSLNVLSAEEAIKGIFVLTGLVSPIYNTNDWKDVFSKHKVKHETIISFLALMEVYKARLKPLIKRYNELIEQSGKVSKLAQNKILVETKHLREEIEWLKTQESNPELIKESLRWWEEQANNEKNNGFYVREKSGWKSPNESTKEDYLRERRYSKELLMFADRYSKTILNPQVIKLMKEDKEMGRL